MGVPYYLVPGEGKESGESVADDRRSQMPDMHRLRHVGACVVDQDGAGRLPELVAELVVCRGPIRPFGERFGGQAQIDETGPGNVRKLDFVQLGQSLGDFGRDLTRRSSCDLGSRHRSVALELGELGSLRGEYLAESGRQAQVFEDLPDNMAQVALDGHCWRG